MRTINAWAPRRAIFLGVALCCACQSEGVGDPCIPEEEYLDTFAGFSANEVSTESRSYQCQTRMCLVNHFQGRVSCPYGQTSAQAAGDAACRIPGSDEPVVRAVTAQLAARRAQDSVYCSCRCAGPDPDARYCECPAGFSCSGVVPNVALGHSQLPGAYCIKEGTKYDRGALNQLDTCDPGLQNCSK